MRSAVYLACLYEVNKLLKSKASWPSIIPKWEVGEANWRGGERWRAVEQDTGEWVKVERRTWEKIDSWCYSRTEWPRYLLTLSLFPILLDALSISEEGIDWKRREDSSRPGKKREIKFDILKNVFPGRSRIRLKIKGSHVNAKKELFIPFCFYL